MHEFMHVVGSELRPGLPEHALNARRARGARVLDGAVSIAAARDDKSGQHFGDEILRGQDSAEQIGMIIHPASLSVVCGNSTVADGGEVTSLPAERPALCTTCDHRLDDASIRACSVQSCPHAQKEAA